MSAALNLWGSISFMAIGSDGWEWEGVPGGGGSDEENGNEIPPEQGEAWGDYRIVFYKARSDFQFTNEPDGVPGYRMKVLQFNQEFDAGITVANSLAAQGDFLGAQDALSDLHDTLYPIVTTP